MRADACVKGRKYGRGDEALQFRRETGGEYSAEHHLSDRRGTSIDTDEVLNSAVNDSAGMR